MEAGRGCHHRGLGLRRRCQEDLSGRMEGAEALSAHRGAAEVSFNFEEGLRGAAMAAPLFFMAHRAIRLGHCSPRTAVTIETATDQPTFSKFMGIRILEISPDSVKAELPIREDFKNRGGVMHGGAVMALEIG